MQVPTGSLLIGKTLEQVERPCKVRITAAQFANGIRRMGPGGLDRNVGIEANTILAVMGAPDALEVFAADYGLNKRPDLDTFSESLSAAKAGTAEVVIPPGSGLIGKSAMEIRLRNVYGLAMIALHRAGETSQVGQGVRDIEFQAGDTLVCHTTWMMIARVITTGLPKRSETVFTRPVGNILKPFSYYDLATLLKLIAQKIGWHHMLTALLILKEK